MSQLKILACGDIHLNVDLLTRAYDIAHEEDVSLVLLVGDFCSGDKLPNDATPDEFVSQAKSIINTLKGIKIPTFFVLGNHEPATLGPRLDELPNVTDIHGQRLLWNEYRISGIGGSHSVVSQLVHKTLPFLEGIIPEIEGIEPPKGLESVRTVMLNQIAHNIYSSVQSMYQSIFPCDILVSHTPPLLPTRTNDFMMYSAGLYKLVEQHHPLIAVSGHIHHPEKYIETIEWAEDNYRGLTTLVNLGSIENRKVGLVQLESKSENPTVEMRSL